MSSWLGSVLFQESFVPRNKARDHARPLSCHSCRVEEWRAGRRNGGKEAGVDRVEDQRQPRETRAHKQELFVVIPCCTHACRGQGPVGVEKATAPLIRAGPQWRIITEQKQNRKDVDGERRR
jgi:hypothetical protein